MRRRKKIFYQQSTMRLLVCRDGRSHCANGRIARQHMPFEPAPCPLSRQAAGSTKKVRCPREFVVGPHRCEGFRDKWVQQSKTEKPGRLLPAVVACLPSCRPAAAYCASLFRAPLRADYWAWAATSDAPGSLGPDNKQQEEAGGSRGATSRARLSTPTLFHLHGTHGNHCPEDTMRQLGGCNEASMSVPQIHTSVHSRYPSDRAPRREQHRRTKGRRRAPTLNSCHAGSRRSPPERHRTGSN
ncbi:hypothetical protein FB567DRAFT_618770 [Paraphoma chrysanthemicola]|uniref:Uncharacterized protein n=1 Tax=Paraphoma chrysanthemicola TaxID=798071 RepID=A0A8K0R9L7_9PLEO|nr:hypothetical protein FB567DRAFT_618770 [Paraphoma chrysanthemicola]